MITAGDERLKTQGGNNNAYCQDNIISWQHWEKDETRDDFYATTKHLIALRQQNPALRQELFSHEDLATDTNGQTLWFKGTGQAMSVDEDWHNPERRSMQRLSFNKNPDGTLNGALLVINGREETKEVTLPENQHVARYALVWDSSLARPGAERSFDPGSNIKLSPTSMMLFLVQTVS
jgi:glycogen operon protein